MNLRELAWRDRTLGGIAHPIASLFFLALAISLSFGFGVFHEMRTVKSRAPVLGAMTEMVPRSKP